MVGANPELSRYHVLMTRTPKAEAHPGALA